MKKFKVIIAIEALAIFLLGFTLITQLIGFTWAREEVFTDCQPDSINYNSYDPYCVLIIDKVQTFGIKREVWITKSIDHNYGYVISYPSSYYYTWDEKVTMGTSIDWNSEEVSININDLTIVVPKEKFIGGR
jgi:hypothetical protein